MRRRIGAVALLLIAAAVFTHALVQARTLSGAYTGVSVRMADGGLTADALSGILPTEAEDRLTLTAAWTWGKPATAFAESLQTSAALRVAAVWGDMRQTEPTMTLLSGGLPAEDDWRGCLLDAASAQTLFHAIDPIGATLAVDGRAYTVRGVAKTYAPVLFVRSENAAYENLEFAPMDVSTGQADVKTYLYRHALSADYAVVQGGLYARMLTGLVLLPAALLLLAAAVRTLRLALPRSRRLWSRILLLFLTAALAAAAVLLLWKTWYWPQAFLPTKAADFAFWRTLATEWKTAWQALSLTTPLPKEILFYRQTRGALCGTAAVAVLLACFWGLTAPGRRTLPKPEL